jgi:putative hydroxymethylpyrimidine transport system ATP-binding protein
VIGLYNTSILSIKELSYSFKDEWEAKSIFQKISMDVKDGEFVSIIGASGSGKSTLFKLIAGLLEPNQGQIWIDGQETKQRLGKVGYMPQKDLLLPWRTVVENVMLPVEITRDNKKRKNKEIQNWLSRFGLAEYEKAFPHELSGGMRQRVAFLRTIMTGQELLLLDEPFGSLDSLTTRSMHSWLLELWGDLKKTVLFITHDLEEAILLSDYIYFLPNQSSQDIQKVQVNLPRPRSSDIVYQSEFIAKRKELEWLINHEG